jgi:hypothetical protein
MSQTDHFAFSPADWILSSGLAGQIDRESSGKIGQNRAFSDIVGHESGIDFQNPCINPRLSFRNAIFSRQDLEKCPITQGGISGILGHQLRFYVNFEGGRSRIFRGSSQPATSPEKDHDHWR